MEQDTIQDIQDLVILRLEESSEGRLTLFGFDGSDQYTKQDLIEEVRKGSDIGKKIIDVELNYLRSLANGDLLRQVSEI
jgi:hypothetical protein